MNTPHLFVIRHGLTDFNTQNRYQGGTDNAINKVGRSQILAVAHTLANQNIDYLVSSPLKRAIQSAEVISQQLDCSMLGR